MGALGDLAQKMSPYLQVLPGQEVTALYKGFKVVPSQLDPEKEVFRYSLEVDGLKKFWTNGKTSVAMVFDQCNEGDIVLIKNSGTKDKGNYSVELVVGKNAEEPKKTK